MKFLRFSYYLFTKNLLMSIIIIIQLTFSLLLVNDVLSTANSYFVTVNEYKQSNLSNINGLIVDIDDQKIPNRMLKKLPSNALKYCEYGYTAFYDEYEFVCYSENFVQDYNPKVESGRWLNKYDIDSETIPVVLPFKTDDFQVGNTYKLDTVDKRIKIIGVLENTFFCSFETGGTMLNTKHMLDNVNGQIVFLTLNKNIPKSDLTLGMSEALILNDSQSIDSSREIISQQYYCRSFKDVLKNGETEAIARVKALSPFIILLILVSITGMIGCLSITTMQNLNYYSILYMNGASKSNCVLISILYTAIFMVITFVFSSIIFIIIMNKRLCNLNIYATIIFIIFMFILSFVPYRLLKINPPVTIFRKTS